MPAKDPKKTLRPSPDVPDRPEPGPPGRSSTSEQLRADIDAGRTRDKVDFPDPAAAPLGTDAEAGGAPASPRAVAADRRAGLERPHAESAQGQSHVIPWAAGLLVAAAVAAGLIVLFVS